MENRRRIIQLSINGMPQRAISAEVGCSVATVVRVVHAYRDEGRIRDAPHGRRPRATTENEDFLIVAAVVDEPFLSAGEIRKELGIAASERTIRGRLKEAGLTCWNANTKLVLTPRFKEIRLNFANEYRRWTANQWQGVVFTTESTLCCKWDKNRRSWRPLHNWNDPIYTRQLAASGHVFVNVWTMVTYQGPGPIYKVKGQSLAPDEYVSVVNDVMLPFLLDGPFLDGTFVLQQDPAPTYKSGLVRNHLDRLGVRRVAWPPKCEDLNPIRSAWALVKERICRKRLTDVSADKLWALFKREWDKLMEIPNLVGGFYSMLPTKMNDVVAAQGGIISNKEAINNGATNSEERAVDTGHTLRTS